MDRWEYYDRELRQHGYWTESGVWVPTRRDHDMPGGSGSDFGPPSLDGADH
jgi:hypothetical protein